MSRSGYIDDYDEMFPNAASLWRANLNRAIAGKRGQTFLKELAEKMDAMPEKRLVTSQLEKDGQVCTLGVMTRARGIDASRMQFDDEDDDENTWVIDGLSCDLNITASMVREIMYVNDEYWKPETPEERWQRMRRWVAKKIRGETDI